MNRQNLNCLCSIVLEDYKILLITVELHCYTTVLFEHVRLYVYLATRILCFYQWLAVCLTLYGIHCWL